MSKIKDLLSLNELIKENNELKDALQRSLDISLRILRNQSVTNFDEFVCYVDHLINKNMKEGKLK